MVVGKVSEFIESLYYLCVTLLRFKNIMKLKNYLLLLALLLVVGVRAQVPSGNKYPKREFRGAWIQAVNGQFRGIPVLGITVMNSDDGRVVVYTVSDGYGAAEMGIRPDDVLLRADGQALGSIDDLMAVRRTHLVGDTITLTVLRDGQTFDVDVPLYANAD